MSDTKIGLSFHSPEENIKGNSEGMQSPPDSHNLHSISVNICRNGDHNYFLSDAVMYSIERSGSHMAA